MEKSMQSKLCKGLRACGLPKSATLEILNTILKWDRECGPEWTVDRIKGYKQWYETCLAGKPEPPPYYRKTKEGYPTGVWGRLFRLKNQAKVLAVLSAHTVYQYTEPGYASPAQLEKFEGGLRGNPEKGRMVSAGQLDQLKRYAETLYRRFKDDPRARVLRSFPELTPVTPADMTGLTIPVSNGTIHMPSENQVAAPSKEELRSIEQSDRSPEEKRKLELRLRKNSVVPRTEQAGIALIQSWRSIPQAVLDYLDVEDHLDWVPENLSDIPCKVPNKRVRGNPVGRIALIQEPGFKLRAAANPNRVAQHFTHPLATYWKALKGLLASDCSMNQAAGLEWVQGKLCSGLELAGTDLTSSTDYLDAECCMQLAKALVWPWLKRADPDSLIRYDNAERYFLTLCRGEWVTPAKSPLPPRVKWAQGYCLGLEPCFELLSLANNALCILSSLAHGLDPEDSFRVCGDDQVGLSAMASTYTKLVEQVGGVINQSKSLTSARVAEFVGHIVTPERMMLKTYRFKQASDDNFMNYVSDLGPQAKCLLANRQRKMWEQFKYVPGVAYDGPWSKDSFGQPLATRVAWTETTPIVDEVPEPDPAMEREELVMLRAERRVAEAEGISLKEVEKDLPWPIEDSIHESLVSSMPKPSGDPRRKRGKSTLQVLEGYVDDPRYRSYPEMVEHYRMLALLASQQHPGREIDSSYDPENPESDLSDPGLETGRDEAVGVDQPKVGDAPPPQVEESRSAEEPHKGPLPPSGHIGPLRRRELPELSDACLEDLRRMESAKNPDKTDKDNQEDREL